jgi:hypothetical protein
MPAVRIASEMFDEGASQTSGGADHDREIRTTQRIDGEADITGSVVFRSGVARPGDDAATVESR